MRCFLFEWRDHLDGELAQIPRGGYFGDGAAERVSMRFAMDRCGVAICGKLADCGSVARASACGFFPSDKLKTDRLKSLCGNPGIFVGHGFNRAVTRPK